MNKQEAIELFKNNTYRLFGSENEGVPLEIAIGTVQLINGPAKVIVPKFVAEWLEYMKEKKYSLRGALERASERAEVYEWMYPENELVFVRAWLDGYEVEQEQLYRVEFPTSQQLYKNHPNGSSKEVIVIKFAHYAEKDGHFTKRELKEAGFGWVFDCEGVKVEEVK